MSITIVVTCRKGDAYRNANVILRAYTFVRKEDLGFVGGNVREKWAQLHNYQ